MNWTEPEFNHRGVKGLTRTQSITPLGVFVIVFNKSENPIEYRLGLQYADGYPGVYWFDAHPSLDSAKDYAHEYLISKHRELSEFLNL